MSLLKTESLSKRFGELLAVDGVSFEVNEGEIYGLLGPNGAGKTTTISMACGLLKADGGDVWINGSRFWSRPQEARQLMGVVPQDLALYEELSGRENLEFWGKVAGMSSREAKIRAVELLESLSLAERAGELVSKYSGGMKRRINLGCALMHRPKLILLDEPTVGIDPQARNKILEYIRELVKEGSGILYTTHYLEEAETLCDRIGIIDKGRLLTEGTLSELQKGVGHDQLFVLEGAFKDEVPEAWGDFSKSFRIIQRTDTQMTVATEGNGDPAEGLKKLLALPVRLQNVTLKRPSLNDAFLKLTGRDLRE
ncbi:ABC transporter, ATP-binding protein [Verrucomicrobiia bacterium DG1235]|nr:ABC transporter, ATP-binding protein [Verrucomicrobiae bacterium DG1235]